MLDAEDGTLSAECSRLPLALRPLLIALCSAVARQVPLPRGWRSHPV